MYWQSGESHPKEYWNMPSMSRPLRPASSRAFRHAVVVKPSTLGSPPLVMGE